MTVEVQVIACWVENETLQEKIHALEEVIHGLSSFDED